MDDTQLMKESPSLYMLTFIFKCLTAFIVGTTATLVFHTFLRYGTFGFVFIGVVFAGIVLKIISKYTFMKVFLFNAAFLFLLLLLKTYITVAPNL
jgi:hypothetical protein